MINEFRQICFVIPFFNEELRIDDSYFRELFGLNFEFLLVDDGSTDSTPVMLERYSMLFENVTYIQLPQNLGKSEAIRMGSAKALEEFECCGLGFLDADGAISITDVVEISQFFLLNAHSYDSIWKSRVLLSGRKIERKLIRHYLSRLLASILGFVCPVLPYDTQCGLKLFKVSSNLKVALGTSFKTKWFIDLEIYVRLFKEGEPPNVWEIPCREWRDVPNSKITFAKFFSIARELVHVIRNLSMVRRMASEG